MADVLSKGTLFPEVLIPDMINLVRGKSALANLTDATPVAFNGNTEFTFTLDKEVDIVAENGAKTKGGATVTPVKIVPIKVEYGARISDEFIYASEEVKLNYLKTFAEGFAKKMARGLDIMAINGYNPRTATASSVIGTNNFSSAITNVVTESAGVNADTNIESAVELVQASDAEVNGLALSQKIRGDLAKLTNTAGEKVYPELAWGAQPKEINGLRTEVNSTVSFGTSKVRAILGDFDNCFKWGYAKEIPLEVIEYGNPDNDNTLGDLKGHNQVYLRAEAYIGWGILDKNAFSVIKAA